MAKRRGSRNSYQRRENERDKFRTNEQIRIPDVRLVGDGLEAISEIVGKKVEPGVYNTRQVLDWARQVELDVVEISPKADPPVVKIIDYNKFLYEKKKREKEIEEERESEEEGKDEGAGEAEEE